MDRAHRVRWKMGGVAANGKIVRRRAQSLHRPAVASILQDRAGRILICERADALGAGQFPQGGIETGETAVAALIREVLEEISLPRSAYGISCVRGPYRYRFAAGITKNGFHGQAHYYFLLRLRGPKSLVNVAGPNAEFRSARWIRPDKFDLAWLPPMKRQAYRRVLQDFFGATAGIKANSD